MAGDWIKFEKATQHKPEVIRIARILGISIDEAIGKVIRFWCWIDDICVDGVVDGVVDADVDAVVSTVGLASALVSVGWLIVDAQNSQLRVPLFDRHNGETAKRRAEKSRRQAAWRSKVDAPVDVSVDAPVDAGVDATVSTKVSTREEKRREESNTRKESCAKESQSGLFPDSNDPEALEQTNPPPSERKPRAKPDKPKPNRATIDEWESQVRGACKNPEVITTLMTWYRYKLARGEAYLETSVPAQIARARDCVEAYGPQVLILAVTRAVANNWAGWDHTLSELASEYNRTEQAKIKRQNERVPA